ncbi:MAG: hypothetical protein LKG27_03125 [Clostridiaceae bacterium]|jgi:hypothetical protein|nr:hypothetical protein [Clostridiaceae bacterium]
MNTFFKVLYIILFVILTLGTIATHPDVHKPVILENQDFKITEVQEIQKQIEQQPVSTMKPATTNTTHVVHVVQPKTYTIPTEPAISNQNNWIFQQNKPAQQQRVVYVNQPKSTTQRVVSKPTPHHEKTFEEIVNESQKNPNKNLTNNEVKTVVKTLTGQQNEQPKPQVNNHKNGNPYMTDQEEIIAWNKWRANFQNAVMQNSGNIAAPLGTVFMFSCIVDKYGNISNINTWSTASEYTPISKRYVKPAIAGLQRSSVLNFPRGTRRTSTIVAGSFVMSTADRYASPNDYSDYERVK